MLLPMIENICVSLRPYRSMFDVWTCLSVMIEGACLLGREYAHCDVKTSASPLTAEMNLKIFAASGDWWCSQFLGAFTYSRPAYELASAQWHRVPACMFPRLWQESWCYWIVSPRWMRTVSTMCSCRPARPTGYLYLSIMHLGIQFVQEVWSGVVADDVFLVWT